MTEKFCPADLFQMVLCATTRSIGAIMNENKTSPASRIKNVVGSYKQLIIVVKIIYLSFIKNIQQNTYRMTLDHKFIGFISICMVIVHRNTNQQPVMLSMPLFLLTDLYSSADSQGEGLGWVQTRSNLHHYLRVVSNNCMK